MKKTLFLTVVFLAVMAMSCQNTGKKTSKVIKAEVKQRVEQMMLMDATNEAEKLLTADLYALQKRACSVHFLSDYFWGFQWNLAVMDACSDTQTVNMEEVKPIDSLHCDVDMRYIDGDCYNEPYTLHLLKEKGEWKIDDVVYGNREGGTLRGDCEAFYEEMMSVYSTSPAVDIMKILSDEEPLEENYTNPESIYCNNPDAIKRLIDELKCCHELFMHNPEYTADYGQQIDAMVMRIAAHL